MPRDPEFEQILDSALPQSVKLEPIAPLYNGVKMSILLRRTERKIATQAKAFSNADDYYAWAVEYYNKIVAKIGEKLVFEAPPAKAKRKVKPVAAKPAPIKRTPKAKPTPAAGAA